MRFVGGTLANITAGAEVALSSHAKIEPADKVLSVEFRARVGNAGNAYVGINGMTSTDGFEMQPGESVSISPKDFGGSIRADGIFVDVATGSTDDVDFLSILE